MYGKSKQHFVKLVVLFLLAPFLIGCGFTIGGYQHYDLSQSHYKHLIITEADKLAKSNNPDDLKTAAELYGLVGQLEKMDSCVEKYFMIDPARGKNLLIHADKIHAYYSK